MVYESLGRMRGQRNNDRRYRKLKDCTECKIRLFTWPMINDRTSVGVVVHLNKKIECSQD